MLSVVTRRFALAVALFAAFTLAGCADKEPTQRQAFIEFLQKRVLSSRLAVPKLSEKEREAVGPYAAHYQVILDFHAGMDQVVYPLKDNSLNQKLGSMQGMQANWKDIPAARDMLAKLPEGLDAQLKKAQAARAALKQPDDLKAVYDQAFDKKVVALTETARKFLALQDQALLSSEAMGRFLDENRDKLTVSGAMIRVNDQSIFPTVQAMQQKHNDVVKAWMAARQELMGGR